jgi:hypothetical protein
MFLPLKGGRYPGSLNKKGVWLLSRIPCCLGRQSKVKLEGARVQQLMQLISPGVTIRYCWLPPADAGVVVRRWART